jgi:hypothetical protein
MPRVTMVLIVRSENPRLAKSAPSRRVRTIGFIPRAGVSPSCLLAIIQGRSCKQESRVCSWLQSDDPALFHNRRMQAPARHDRGR